MTTPVNELKTDILVIGGGTGGTAAALSAARRGANTILVSEFPWLGGMLTSAGVSAVDGNELIPFQTGIWGQFLRTLQQQQPEGLDHGWVSFFNFDPRIGNQIFTNWVHAQPNLRWIWGQKPLEVLQENHRIMGVRFEDYLIKAQIILDGTELGDVLALADVPHRWGWELQQEWGEPSAPVAPTEFTERSPVQAPTWVALLKDYGSDGLAPEIPPPPQDNPELFLGATEGYEPQQFLNYGRLPGGLLMMNWPIRGNDYGQDLNRLIRSEAARQEFCQESLWHTQSFVREIQHQFGRHLGLAHGVFPWNKLHHSYQPQDNHLLSAFALHPYYRESRRLQGLTTIREQDILPLEEGQTAALPMNDQGECDAIAIGNYLNDHHYTNGYFPLKQKLLRWGGRWTGTPFTIPYRALIPREIDGLMVCEKNISVSHIANGATRLQPVVLGIGQAAGLAAALCIEQNCQPRDLPVRHLQNALLKDAIARAAIIPLLNLPLNHPQWLDWQIYYLNHPEDYPISGNFPDQVSPVLSKTVILNEVNNPSATEPSATEQHFNINPLAIASYNLEFSSQTVETQSTETLTQLQTCSGIFHRHPEQNYTLTLTAPSSLSRQTWTVVTLHPHIHEQLQHYPSESPLTVQGRLNASGHWLLVEFILPLETLKTRS